MDLHGLLDALTLDEKAGLTCGRDMWTVAGIPERGIPDIVLTDGPNGARGSALLGAGRVSAACLPCGIALGATWDPGLLEEVGAVLGEEARTKSARVLLAPTINLVRSPLAGRTFESYSEDPLLTGLLAAGFVRGVQSRGVAATVKHFIGNEAEHERTTISSDIDERALRELYLVPFELAIRGARPLAVMTAYNRLNGSWCTEDRALLQGILRDELGFDGVVMTDWFGVGSTRASAMAGVDLQMPGPARFFGPPLADAVRSGAVPAEVLDASVLRWLRLIDLLGAWADEPGPERAVDRPEHRAVARRAATDATVLLRNDGLLPLDATTVGTVALIGPNATRAHIMGGGSAQLRPHRWDSPAAVLRERLGDRLLVEPGCRIDKTVQPLVPDEGFTLRFTTVGAGASEAGVSAEPDGRLLWFGAPLAGLDENAFAFQASGRLTVRDGGRHRFTMVQCGTARVSLDGVVVLDGMTERPPPGTDLFGLGSAELEVEVELAAGSTVEVLVDYAATGSVFLHGVKLGHAAPEAADLLGRAVAAASAADVAVVVVGTSAEWETEGQDRELLDLPGGQDELVNRVCTANPRTIVVVNAGSAVAMPWADLSAAVVMSWLGGQEMAEGLADVLFGLAEPAGRLPLTVPMRIEHTPAFGAFPGDNDHVPYREGLLMGYRWFDTRAITPRFAFGQGGSYTTFVWGQPELTSTDLASGEAIEVTVAVTNTGTRRGAEVVQCYVEPVPGRLMRPRRELRGFAKVWVDPGETATAQITLDARSFAFWDPGSPETAYLASRLGAAEVVPAGRRGTPVAQAGWQVEAGPHRILLARSVADVVSSAVVQVGWSGPVGVVS
ncbi:MAG: glycoside hydrolase family 3 C-terminal domain-containing protein [Actinomycetota bacterium]|nr:glycoside hydrolase family 3 C-terminal domain-containing protein [Actinomycetota bacterium]